MCVCACACENVFFFGERLTLFLHRHPLVEGNLVQEHGEGGGERGWVIEQS